MSSRSDLDFPVVAGLVILLFLSEVIGEVAENRRSVSGTSFERRDAAGPSPAGAALDAYDDELVEEAAILEEPHGRFRREFVGAEFADADQVAQPLGFLRLGEFQEGIESMNLAARRRLAVL